MNSNRGEHKHIEECSSWWLLIGSQKSEKITWNCSLKTAHWNIDEKYQDIEITCYFFIRSNIQNNAKQLFKNQPFNVSVTLYIRKWSSDKERRVDALALRADEGRD